MTVTARLVVARHAEARCNVEGRVGGPRTCTGLTEVGRGQAALLAARLAAERRDGGPAFHALYAGPRRRVQETGAALAPALGLPLAVDQGLEGPVHGEADGRLWREVEDAFRGAPHTHPNLPCAPGAETWHAYLDRATAHLAELLRHHPGRNVLLTAHGETVHAACHLLLRIPVGASGAVGFGTHHTGLTRFEHRRDRYGNGRWVLTALDDTTHLGPRPA
ncbi:histidine phosphatase family protein [Streptomyces virginiae]|uniref:histidine phosphatase family protein n=1 Tax=Streptomyces virginiae TaxID=1961 RepID=UPI00224EBB48|nr:histidine phosphatase family protein [Streptomyces virginiae]MCX4958987.1 histidine phosphatase family protein [Streptomyces virginiae]MCX5177816.1 histidine phosphatase family protein [Streptomyces virginiae]